MQAFQPNLNNADDTDILIASELLRRNIYTRNHLTLADGKRG